MSKVKMLPKGLYKQARGSIVFIPSEGPLSGQAFVLGDSEITRNYTTEDAERYSNERAKKTLAYREVDQEDLILNITLMQMTKFNQSLAHMSDASTKSQTAQTGLSLTVEDFDFSDDGSVIEIPAMRISNVVVSDGDAVDPVVFVEGTDYTIVTGEHDVSIINIFGKPDGAGANVKVDYDRLASKGFNYDIFSKTEVLGKLIYVEDIKEAAGRSAETHVYLNVGLKVDGDFSLTNGETDPRQITLEGTCYRDLITDSFGYVVTQVEAA